METLFYLHGKFSVEDKLVIIENVTEDDYWSLSNEDLKVEFARGRLYIHSPASIKHELIFKFLLRLINYQLEKNDLGEMLGSRVAVKLPNGHRPEPDLLYLHPDEYDINQNKIFEGTPKWIIEILSPSTRNHDLNEKLNWYEEAQVEEVWIVDPENEYLIQNIYDNKSNSFKSKIRLSSVTPLDFNFSIKIDWLWERPKISDIVD